MNSLAFSIRSAGCNSYELVDWIKSAPIVWKEKPPTVAILLWESAKRTKTVVGAAKLNYEPAPIKQ
jgi:hypothetical protein